jgi:hypothetical protein
MGNFINGDENSKVSNKNPIQKKFDPLVFILRYPDIKNFNIYALSKIRPHHLTKIDNIIENFHKNGIPRKSDDFSYKNYTKFYPKEDPFFNLEEADSIHNHIKIYNENESNMNLIQIYKGDLNIRSERHGIGKLITQYYELNGMWKNDNFTGWGRQSRCNGEVFEGRFVNGLLNGKGIYLDSKSNKYLGEFKDMKRWGKGKLNTDTILYEGDFYDNKIQGKGKIKFLKSGIEYEGTFINDNIEGSGIFKWINGDIYEGEVKDGKMHGNGIYKYKNGKIYKGLFENGQIANNGNLKNSSSFRRNNYSFETEKINYLNPYRKIYNLSLEMKEDYNENNFKPIKTNQNYNQNINKLNNNKESKYSNKTFNYDKENKTNYEIDFDKNISNINEFIQNKDLNIHMNNKYNLNNVSKINNFNQDKNNKIKNNFSTNLIKNNQFNNNIIIKEKEERPDLMMSTYRNFGFGGLNDNIS